MFSFITSDGLVTWGNVSAYCLDTATAQLETYSDALSLELYDLVKKRTVQYLKTMDIPQS